MSIVTAGGFIHQSQCVHFRAGGVFVRDLVVMRDETASSQEQERGNGSEITETVRVHCKLKAVFFKSGVASPPFNTTFRGRSSSKTFKKMTFDLAQRPVRILTRESFSDQPPRCLDLFAFFPAQLCSSLHFSGRRNRPERRPPPPSRRWIS